MKANIDLSAVAEQLAECRPGDEYVCTFVVDTKTDTGLTGTASEIEHIDGEYGEEEPSDEQMTHGAAGAKRKVPKAILMISK